MFKTDRRDEIVCSKRRKGIGVDQKGQNLATNHLKEHYTVMRGMRIAERRSFSRTEVGVVAFEVRVEDQGLRT